MPRCPECNNKIHLKVFGYNKQYHCNNCYASLVEDKNKNHIAVVLMIVNIIIIPLILSLFSIDKTYIILAACVGGLLIYNFIPKLKVKNET